MIITRPWERLVPPPSTFFFFEGSNSIVGHGGTVEIRKVCQNDQVYYGVEPVVITEKDVKNVSKEIPTNYVLGYTVGNDVSSR
jgi:2-keto-4-pentenoate hydratase/2-oxohepta-3-ene-1,7-dioic acid hydratase in catechol pathway